MSYLTASEQIKKDGFADHIIHLDISTATVEMAANALEVIPARIAKTLSFLLKDGSCILIVLAGDASVDNHKYKEKFGCKASMLSFDQVEPLIGHQVGGVCPFGIKEGVKVYADQSLKRFSTVFPSCGDVYNVLKLTPDELFSLSHAAEWIDVGKNWDTALEG